MAKRKGGPRPNLSDEEIVILCMEGLAEPDLAANLPGWRVMDERAVSKFPDRELRLSEKIDHRGGWSRRPFINRRRNLPESEKKTVHRENERIDREALEAELIETLRTEEGSARLRRTGRATKNGFMGLGSPQILDELRLANINTASDLADHFAPHVALTFRGAYEARVGELAEKGSSHRLRSMLLAHHNRESLRQILHQALFENLMAHRPILEEILEIAGFESMRSLDAVLLDLAALLDGYLQQAVCETHDHFDSWSERFVESVAFFVETNFKVRTEL